MFRYWLGDVSQPRIKSLSLAKNVSIRSYSSSIVSAGSALVFVFVMVHVGGMGFFWSLVHLRLLGFIAAVVHMRAMDFVQVLVHVSNLGFVRSLVHVHHMGVDSVSGCSRVGIGFRQI